MTIIYIPRSFGGTLILNVILSLALPVPIEARGRDGLIVAYGRDGQIAARGRDGMIEARGDDGYIASFSKDGLVVGRGR